MNNTSESPVAVVAGGGSGIGYGCARRLAKMGYRVIVVGRDAAKLDAAVKNIIDSGGDATAFSADVRDWNRLGELHALVADTGIDLLINSAGGQFAQPSAELSRDGWQSVVDINLSGSFFCAVNCNLPWPSDAAALCWWLPICGAAPRQRWHIRPPLVPASLI